MITASTDFLDGRTCKTRVSLSDLFLSMLFLMVPISNKMCKNLIAMVEFGLLPSYEMF